MAGSGMLRDVYQCARMAQALATMGLGEGAGAARAHCGSTQRMRAACIRRVLASRAAPVLWQMRGEAQSEVLRCELVSATVASDNWTQP